MQKLGKNEVFPFIHGNESPLKYPLPFIFHFLGRKKKRRQSQTDMEVKKTSKLASFRKKQIGLQR